MIRVQLKKRFETNSEAVQLLMGIVNPGDESYFEFVGKEKKGSVEKNSLLEDLKKIGLVEVCNHEKPSKQNSPARLYRPGMRR